MKPLISTFIIYLGHLSVIAAKTNHQVSLSKLTIKNTGISRFIAHPSYDRAFICHLHIPQDKIAASTIWYMGKDEFPMWTYEKLAWIRSAQ